MFAIVCGVVAVLSTLGLLRPLIEFIINALQALSSAVREVFHL